MGGWGPIVKPDLLLKRQRATVFVALLLFNLVLILLQLWLFASVLEAMAHGVSQMAIPGAVASVGLFLVNLWMLGGLRRLD